MRGYRSNGVRSSSYPVLSKKHVPISKCHFPRREKTNPAEVVDTSRRSVYRTHENEDSIINNSKKDSVMVRSVFCDKEL